MSEERDIMKCDLCDKKATNWTRDVERRVITAEQRIERVPVGPIRARCKDHIEESQEIEVRI